MPNTAIIVYDIYILYIYNGGVEGYITVLFCTLILSWSL